ncbi:MAG: substrate-binding domain-containing protein, partial [bacterium]|nr:substrate-binding domain-containing protein [bacterium]
VSYGGGGEALARMALSGKGDVLLAPEQWIMERATREGAVIPETIRTVAYMVPVIAVRKGNPRGIRTLADLAAPGTRVAISRPETTLLGTIATDMFEKAGLADAIGANVVTQAPDPGVLLAMLLMGQVDAGIIWHFYRDLAGGGIETIPLPCDGRAAIAEMQAAVSSYSTRGGEALGFVEFMASAEGRSVWEEHGYLMTEAEAGALCD